MNHLVSALLLNDLPQKGTKETKGKVYARNIFVLLCLFVAAFGQFRYFPVE
jgi:hypothetical protein